MNRYDIVVFDMDGTVLDTLEDLTDAVNVVLRRHGLPEKERAEVRRFLGNGARRLLELSLPEGTDEETVRQYIAEFLTEYQQHCDDHTKPYDGIVPLLRTLKSRGVKTAVVSNKADAAVQKLCRTCFPDCFDYAAGEIAGIPRKPAAEPVLLAIKTLKTAGRAVYVGDSEVDAATARNAGLELIAVSWGFRDREELEELGIRKIADSPEQLLEYLS
ncbi:MAG: HAD-IA family hydrolase [Lachnospiraceae bacterium]|nr:HAD-IA family hydrolase [Lachnospiraceae bacterium]